MVLLASATRGFNTRATKALGSARAGTSVGAKVGAVIGALVAVGAGVLVTVGNGVGSRRVGEGLIVGFEVDGGIAVAASSADKSAVGEGAAFVDTISQGITPRYKATAASSRPMMTSHCRFVIDERECTGLSFSQSLLYAAELLQRGFEVL